MADVVDITSERDEITIQHAIRAARQAGGPQPNGRCHFCDEIVDDHSRWCDADCHDDWEREQGAKKRNGA